MRTTAWHSDAQEIHPFRHRHREAAADQVQQRAVAFLAERSQDGGATARRIFFMQGFFQDFQDSPVARAAGGAPLSCAGAGLVLMSARLATHSGCPPN